MRQQLLLLLALAGFVDQTAGASSAVCFSYTQESACTDVEGCEWTQVVGSGGACVGISCPPETAAAECNTRPGCTFDDSCPEPEDQQCVEQICDAGDLESCVSDDRCQWSSRLKCTVATCGEYPSEKCCRHDPECEWDVTVAPALCRQTYCPKTYTTQSACDQDSTCLWSTSLSKCLVLNCNELNACACRNTAGCFLDTAKDRCVESTFGQCPTLDVVLLIDGSGSMTYTFGRHPHGFYALIEILRDWIHSVPLTGEKARDKNLPPEGPTTGGLRVGIIQFSGKNAGWYSYSWEGITYWYWWDGYPESRETYGNIGTGGLLSGDVNELDDDLDWHDKYFLHKGTMIQGGLEDAGRMFDDSELLRQRVLFIITDGQIFDPHRLAPARKKLDKENVETFGVVVRRQSYHTSADRSAELTLAPVTSDPNEDHIMNIMLDEITSSVLNDMCNPRGKFGSLIMAKTNTPGQAGVHQPCSSYENSNACTVDAGCKWHPSDEECEDSPCFKHCDQPTCAADTVNLCLWDDKTGCLKETICAFHDEKSCADSPQDCKWDGTECNPAPCTHNTLEEDCLADTNQCTWVDGCVVTPCTAGVEADCKSNPQCVWEIDACDGSTAMCGMAGCTGYSAASDCRADPRCLWAGGKCSAKTCTEFHHEACCDANAGCKWDITTTPTTCQQKECYAISGQQNCEDDTNCMW
ncbi:putative Membrane-associated protein, partial [Diplonema papillatum]